MKTPGGIRIILDAATVPEAARGRAGRFGVAVRFAHAAAKTANKISSLLTHHPDGQIRNPTCRSARMHGGRPPRRRSPENKPQVGHGAELPCWAVVAHNPSSSRAPLSRIFPATRVEPRMRAWSGLTIALLLFAESGCGATPRAATPTATWAKSEGDAPQCENVFEWNLSRSKRETLITEPAFEVVGRGRPAMGSGALPLAFPGSQAQPLTAGTSGRPAIIPLSLRTGRAPRQEYRGGVATC